LSIALRTAAAYFPLPSALRRFRAAMDELQQITQHLLRFSPDALIVVDGDGLIRFANDTVTELFGHSARQLLGQPLDTLIPERLRTRHVAHLAGYLRAP